LQEVAVAGEDKRDAQTLEDGEEDGVGERELLRLGADAGLPADADGLEFTSGDCVAPSST